MPILSLALQEPCNIGILSVCLLLKMAGVGRGTLRPNTGGKQSFAIIALVVVIIVLGVNYWSVTSKNRRLVAEFEKLRKNFKVRVSSHSWHYYRTAEVRRAKMKAGLGFG